MSNDLQQVPAAVTAEQQWGSGTPTGQGRVKEGRQGDDSARDLGRVWEGLADPVATGAKCTFLHVGVSNASGAREIGCTHLLVLLLDSKFDFKNTQGPSLIPTFRSFSFFSGFLLCSKNSVKHPSCPLFPKIMDLSMKGEIFCVHTCLLCKPLLPSLHHSGQNPEPSGSPAHSGCGDTHK